MSGRGILSAGIIQTALLCGAVALTAACVANPTPIMTDQPSTVQSSLSIEGGKMHTSVFEVHVFEPGSLGTLGYSVESSWPLLQQADLDKSVFVITEDDIASYDWTSQTLKLSSELRKKYEADYLNFLANFSPFVVTIDRKPVFGGMILLQFSPLAIKYPVIYVLSGPTYPEEDELSIALRPTHDYRAKLDAPSSFPASDPALTESVRRRFAEIGKLVE